MLKWLKSLFGFDTPDTPIIAEEPKVVEEPKAEPAKKAPAKKAPAKKAPAKKTTTKKAAPKTGTAPKKRGRPKKTQS